MRRACLSAVLVVAFALPARAGAAEVSEGVARFTLPAGWSRAAHGPAGSFATADGTGTLEIGRSKPLTTVEAALDELAGAAAKRPGYREESKRTGGQHLASGGRWTSYAYTYADAARPDRFEYVWAVVVGAGGRAVAITATFADAAAFNRYLPELGRMVDRLRLTSAIVLEKGDPPLTQFTLDETIDFLEWLIGSPLTDAERQTVETEVRGSWKKGDRAEIDGTQKLLELREQLAALLPEKRELTREAVLPAAIAEWRKDESSASSRMMVQIYDAAHEPIAEGSPPLTRQGVDAFSELLCFAAGQTVGLTFTPSEDLKKKLSAAVAGKYASLAHDQQQLVASMPLTWAALRAAWPELGEADRRRLVDGWKQDPSLVALGHAIQGGGAPNPSSTPASSGGSSPLSTLQDARRQALMYQTMSNVMMMQYETNRAIISNMVGGYRYEYRWR